VQRLGVAVFVNQPWIFSAFWSAIKKVLHEKTCRKVVFMDKDRTRVRAQLLDVFDMDDPQQLEAAYGGASPYLFALPDWLQRETAFFARLRRSRSSAAGPPPPESAVAAMPVPIGISHAAAAAAAAAAAGPPEVASSR
jgi:hypothetical protein